MIARKAVTDGGRYEDILNAAGESFFEKGFDGTTVRGIMRTVGAEIGLFYYYFDSKDDVFDKVLDRFFTGYERDFAAIVEHGRRNPCRLMEDFFSYMELETERYRARYEKTMHRTIRWAIREHTLEITEPYFREIVAIQSAYYNVPPAVDADVAALYLTYGVGSSILHEEKERFFSLRRDIKHGISLLMGLPMEEQELRIPHPAGIEDVDAILALLSSGNDHGCFLFGKDFLTESILKKEVWIFRRETVVAMICFSKDRCSIRSVIVSPSLRRKGLGARLVETVAAQFPVGTLITATASSSDAKSFFSALDFTAGESEPKMTLTTTTMPPGAASIYHLKGKNINEISS